MYLKKKIKRIRHFLAFFSNCAQFKFFYAFSMNLLYLIDVPTYVLTSLHNLRNDTEIIQNLKFVLLCLYYVFS